ITQEMMAKRLGVSPQAISKWEREECYPDITFLPTLAAVLSCTVNDFFE
ncbi:MAG: helix-turn-helix transcriptional regulator, partial [Clostridia bacterium]|nr:helix-turn-helix transcriptional regulator [Clostridia bacterium]